MKTPTTSSGASAGGATSPVSPIPSCATSSGEGVPLTSSQPSQRLFHPPPGDPTGMTTAMQLAQLHL